MKNFFIGISLLTALLLVVFIWITARHRKNFSRQMTMIHIIELFAVISCIIPMITLNKSVATVFTSFYYISITWLLIVFADFLFVFTDTSFKLPLIKLFRTDSFILAIMDSILVLSTIYTDFTFSLTEDFENGVMVGWQEVSEYGFAVHIVFDYMLSLAIGIFLIKKVIDASKFHRQYVILILSCFLILMITSVFLIGSSFKYMIIIYSFASFIIRDFAFHFIPRQMNSKVRTMIAEDISNAVLCFDLNGKCIFMNKVAKSIFESEEKCHEKYFNYNALGLDILNIREVFKANGKLRTFDVTARRFRDKANRLIGTYITFTDVTDEIESLRNEVYQSTHDNLTCLFNRPQFFKEIDLILHRDPDTPRYMVCTDIQNFKLINDFFGIRLGDKILKAEADILRKMATDETIIGRTSGDRFAMLIRKDLFDKDRFVDELSKIQNYIEATQFKLQFHVGIYEITDPYENVTSMYDKAYLSIMDGINQTISFYNTSIMDRLVHEKHILSIFDSALEEGQFKMFLQPQISSTTRKSVGAEALVRWIDKDKGMIPPGDFVPILEKVGLIYKLDKFIWEEAAKKLAEWQKNGINKYIAVNISARDFYYIDLYKTFTNLVDKYEIEPQKLKLEITETILMYDMRSHSKILTKLQKYGFFIEMDDFGSGYSSLNMLKNIKMDVLKIDMAFLDKTSNINRSSVIIESIIKMAKSLGMMVIAEGVEEKTHVDFLTKAGCDIFQGYYYSRPISVEEFEANFIEEGRA